MLKPVFESSLQVTMRERLSLWAVFCLIAAFLPSQTGKHHIKLWLYSYICCTFPVLMSITMNLKTCSNQEQEL